jgi:hypothetical protein
MVAVFISGLQILDDPIVSAGIPANTSGLAFEFAMLECRLPDEVTDSGE